MAVLTILYFVEFYTFSAIQRVLGFSKTLFTIYLAISFGFVILLFASVSYISFSKQADFDLEIVFLLLNLFFVPRAFVTFILVLEDVWSEATFFLSLILEGDYHKVQYNGRRFWVSTLALIGSIVVFIAVLYSNFVGRYNFEINRQTLFFDDLPKEFDGKTILHLSDLDLGTFKNQDKVKHFLDSISGLNPDILVISGGVVVLKAEELSPYVESFKKINPPLGKYASLGLTDIGYFKNWKSISQKEQNTKRLLEGLSESGFSILSNENKLIKTQNDSLYMVGVLPSYFFPLPMKADLNEAMAGVNPGSFKILLSHCPDMFFKQVVNYPPKFQLTLSGFTHGGQFEYSFLGLKFKPFSILFEDTGLHQSKDRKLFINKGLGSFIYTTGRFGAWPEAVLITLKKGAG
ncbi:MAG: hypothetical protein C4K58_05840 [Flavobacteriaceae bacterium]|nr:MAG: hypothetical protein C4K58_05840 [Flavobacteriaceae bacterium]